jgi:hypothetical protein
MTNQTRILAAVASVLTVTAAAPAIAQSVDLIARVPFEFRVGDQEMPRDVYRISRSSGAVIVRSERNAVAVLTRQGKPYTNVDKSRLVFHRVGSQYFLREVQMQGRTALELPETRAEREAMEQLASSAPAGVQRVVILSPR